MPDKGFGVNVNRFAIKSRWMYGLGGSDEINDLEARLQNCVVLENDRFEARLGAGELTFSGVGSVGPLAANFSQVGLLIPAGSGVLVTIEEIIPLQPAAQVNLRRQYGGAGANAGTAIGVDSRMGSSTVAAAQLVSTINGALQGTLFASIGANATERRYKRPITIAASATSSVVIWLDASVVNQAVDGTFRWRERQQENGLLS